MLLAVFSLSACTTTSQTTASLVETSEAQADAGFTVPLPETVAVLPESAFAAQTALADASGGATPALMAAEPAAAAPVMALAAAPAASPLQLASAAAVQPTALSAAIEAPVARSGVDGLIAKYAGVYGLPERFVRRVVKRESTFNPKAYNNGHWGLMQIKHATARGMGYAGPATGLLDADTNLKYAVKYLRGAWLVADGNEDRADRLYQTGYYYHAKRRGMLGVTGLGRDRKRRHQPAAILTGETETPQQVDLPVALNGG